MFIILALKFSSEKLGISRKTFAKAMASEGFLVLKGMLNRFICFQYFNKKLLKIKLSFNLTNRVYEYNMCPNAQSLYENEFIMVEICSYATNEKIIKTLSNILCKIYENIKI